MQIRPSHAFFLMVLPALACDPSDKTPGTGLIDSAGCENDLDADGICDEDDADRDGDGIDDADDAFPDDPDESSDSDGDGVGDNNDLCEGDDATGDADSDGVCDDNDVCEGDDATGDADEDGICDDIDDDRDGDGVPNDDDLYPDDPELSGLFVYLADSTGDEIHRYDLATWTHEQVTTSAELGYASVRVITMGDDGWLYAIAYDSGAVLRLDHKTGELHDVFISGLSNPGSLAFGADGYLYVTTWDGASGCTGSSAISRYDSTGTSMGVFVTMTNKRVHELAVDVDGTVLAVEYCGGGILQFDGSTGELQQTFVESTWSRLYGLAWDGSTLYTGSWATGQATSEIQPIDVATGELGDRFGSGFLAYPSLDDDGLLWTVDYHPSLSATPAVRVYDPTTGEEVQTYAIPEVNYPHHLAILPG